MSLILSFGHPILLRSIGSQKFMLDVLLIKNVFYLCVIKLGAIVTSYLFDISFKLILCPF
jgi:hypothetical protein